MSKHGLTGTDEHRAWKAMRWRCSEKNPIRSRYYDRGIGVCERWDNFANFLKDMGKRPGKRYTLDRIDNDKGYSPENCRWATHKQQANNTSRTNYIMVDGNRVSLMDIHDETGIHPETLRGRIKSGWTYDKIVSEPLKASSRKRDKYGVFI